MAVPDELQRHADEFAEIVGIQPQFVEEGARIFVLLPSVPLPRNLFKVDTTDMLFITDRQYPVSSLDMFWVDLDVINPDGSVPKNADSIERYIGRQWRRFSWHRHGVWNPARNGLLDHYAFVDQRWQEA